MEIGTEISKKIRAAIKGKLQELGAYIDDELPDYIMVMVANKKTPQQMTDDLSLFLGNNTFKFTTWLHGVLEKLRSVAGEPASLKHQLQSDSATVAGKSRSSVGENGRSEESKVLTVSSSRSDRTEARVSSSAHESRKGSIEKSSSRHTSAVKPLMELLPSEAVIDIKPEMDDDLIAEEPAEIGSNHSRAHSRPTAEIYRPGQSKFTSVSSAAMYRSAEGSSQNRQQDSRSSRTSRSTTSKVLKSTENRLFSKVDNAKLALQEELSRKRKAPVASSVVRVSREADEDSDDVEEEDMSYGGRGLSSRVSLPSKPERKPTLPPAKQANRNLILKAISEAQDSITKTTAYPTIPQRQTVPVAPRTRLASSEEMTAAIQLVQEHLHSLAPRMQSYASTDLPPSRTPERGDSASPKFIVTLDGVPSPLGNMTDCDVELDDVRPPMKVTEAASLVHREPKVSVLHRLQGVITPPEDDVMDTEMAEEDGAPLKKQKVMERCKFWPVCKSGDECLYHHPTTQCKTFPNCKFGDKCLFVHPNCKYDARCTKPDCPFTHVSRRGPAAPPPRPVVQPVQTTSVCRFFPECKKMDCPFYHPKPCRFAAQCKRAGCTFYHPTTAVPPRHALKWIKTPSR
uniref:Zinc finger CCCH domain-containing protein 14 n=1 Tax=Amphiprion ocellaris TaxID=80972 RepID=A0A3Q1CXT9_AMPOC